MNSRLQTNACVVAVLVALSLTAGCASLPVTGAPATGEPLSVKAGIVTEHYTVKEKVGEVQHTDSSGRPIGKSEVYADRLETVHREVWKTYQGARPTDDQDFFRIGGDMDAVDRIKSSRASGVTMNEIGLITLGAGAAAIVASFLTRPSVNADGTQGSSGLSSALLVGGSILVPVGGILTYIGLAKTRAEHPLNDAARASEVAARYNATLGSAPPGAGAAVERRTPATASR